MRDFWEETFSVGFSDIDPSDRLTLGAAFAYFQEAAINHAEHLGVGREAMAQTGQVWILSRMSVVLERRPAYRETLTLRSWPRGWEKLFVLREYDIRDASNALIAQGASGWLILDKEKRRPLRPQPLIKNMPLNRNLPILSGGAAGLETRENLVKTGERRALYSDIDYNGHVNNTRYIQWIQDALEPKILESAAQMRLDINYLKEIKAGEVVELWTVPGGSPRIALEGRRQAGGPALFRAELWTDTMEGGDER